jgi:hypothetical protein
MLIPSVVIPHGISENAFFLALLESVAMPQIWGSTTEIPEDPFSSY